jgi:hypothetical protein
MKNNETMRFWKNEWKIFNFKLRLEIEKDLFFNL